MPIVEYMLHATEGPPSPTGQVWTKKPDFVVEGGYFDKPEDGTFLGYVMPADRRSYYVPDTLTYLTKEQVVQRALTKHATKPYKKLVRIENPSEELIIGAINDSDGNPNAWPMQSVDMNENEVRAMAEEWYDAILAKYKEV